MRQFTKQEVLNLSEGKTEMAVCGIKDGKIAFSGNYPINVMTRTGANAKKHGRLALVAVSGMNFADFGHYIQEDGTLTDDAGDNVYELKIFHLDGDNVADIDKWVNEHKAQVPTMDDLMDGINRNLHESGGKLNKKTMAETKANMSEGKFFTVEEFRAKAKKHAKKFHTEYDGNIDAVISDVKDFQHIKDNLEDDITEKMKLEMKIFDAAACVDIAQFSEEDKKKFITETGVDLSKSFTDKHADGGSVGKKCTKGLRIATLLFDKEHFTKATVKSWLKRNDFKYGNIEEEKNHYKASQEPSGDFTEDSFRTTDLKGRLPKGIQATTACPVKKEDGGSVMEFTDLSFVVPSKIETEETQAMGYPDKLRLLYNGKRIAQFYYNMRGYNPDFSLKNKENVGYGFGGDRSKTEQVREFKKALKDGFVFIRPYYAEGGELAGAIKELAEPNTLIDTTAKVEMAGGGAVAEDASENIRIATMHCLESGASHTSKRSGDIEVEMTADGNNILRLDFFIWTVGILGGDKEHKYAMYLDDETAKVKKLTGYEVGKYKALIDQTEGVLKAMGIHIENKFETGGDVFSDEIIFTTDDNIAAHKDGWAVSYAGAKDGVPHYELIKVGDKFLSFAGAVKHVIEKAKEGSKLHEKALAFIKAKDPVEWNLIVVDLSDKDKEFLDSLSAEKFACGGKMAEGGKVERKYKLDYLDSLSKKKGDEFETGGDYSQLGKLAKIAKAQDKEAKAAATKEKAVKHAELGDAKTYKDQYGGYVKGYVSTWNTGANKYAGLPIVYGIQETDMPGGTSWMIVGGILVDGELVNTSEAYDDWFGDEQVALDAAKEIAANENAFVDEFAGGGEVKEIVVSKISDIPGLQKKVDEGKVTYRGLGIGKLSERFWKASGGQSGTRIKVDGKEYYITSDDFHTLGGIKKIRFAAPYRRGYAEGGEVRFIDVLNKPEGKKLIEQIEDTKSSLDFHNGNDPELKRILDMLHKRMKDEFGFTMPKYVKPTKHAEGGDVSVYGTDAEVEKMYLDYVNNFLTVDAFAEHYNISKEKADRIIELGREINGRLANGVVSDEFKKHKKHAEGGGDAVIGTTQSGKKVYSNKMADHEDYRDFTAKDHEDAGLLHNDRRVNYKLTESAENKAMDIQHSHVEAARYAAAAHLKDLLMKYDASQSPLPFHVWVGGSIDFDTILNKTTFSDGLKKDLINDFKKSGHSDFSKLIGVSTYRTRGNIENSLPGFSSGKYTDLQAEAIANAIHSTQYANGGNITGESIIPYEEGGNVGNLVGKLVKRKNLRGGYNFYEVKSYSKDYGYMLKDLKGSNDTTAVTRQFKDEFEPLTEQDKIDLSTTGIVHAEGGKVAHSKKSREELKANIKKAIDTWDEYKETIPKSDSDKIRYGESNFDFAFPTVTQKQFANFINDNIYDKYGEEIYRKFFNLSVSNESKPNFIKRWDSLTQEEKDILPDYWKRFFQKQYLSSKIQVARDEYDAAYGKADELNDKRLGEKYGTTLKEEWVEYTKEYKDKIKYAPYEIPSSVAVFEGKNQISRPIHKMYGSIDHIKKAFSFIESMKAVDENVKKNYEVVALTPKSYEDGYHAYAEGGDISSKGGGSSSFDKPDFTNTVVDNYGKQDQWHPGEFANRGKTIFAAGGKVEKEKAAFKESVKQYFIKNGVGKRAMFDMNYIADVLDKYFLNDYDKALIMPLTYSLSEIAEFEKAHEYAIRVLEEATKDGVSKEILDRLVKIEFITNELRTESGRIKNSPKKIWEYKKMANELCPIRVATTAARQLYAAGGKAAAFSSTDDLVDVVDILDEWEAYCKIKGEEEDDFDEFDVWIDREYPDVDGKIKNKAVKEFTRTHNEVYAEGGVASTDWKRLFANPQRFMKYSGQFLYPPRIEHKLQPASLDKLDTA